MPTPQLLLTLQASTTTILTVMLGIRLYISYRFLRRSRYRYLEDAAAVTAWLITWVCVGCSMWRGVRTMREDKIRADKVMHAKLVVVEVLGHASVIWCVKAVFLCMYLGMTEGLGVARRRRGWLWGGAVAVLVTYLVVLGVHAGHCWPLRRNW
jgi:hypothetical protein